jgi:hypothetical protein
MAKRDFSPVGIWEYGHEVLALTKELHKRLIWAADRGGENNPETFRELQAAIRQLHDLLEEMPEELRTRRNAPPPLTEDEIPF